MPPRARLALLALGGLGLLSGLDAALLLLGVWAPVTSERLPDVHGMVMVLGFLGTVISLERAQALGRPWGYLAPAVLGAGGLALAAGAPSLLGQLLLVQGCLLFGAVYLALYRRTPAALVAVQALSVALALCGALLWLRVSVAELLPWLAGFLILAIAAERAELARLTMGPRATPTLVVLASGLTAAAAASLLWPDVGSRVFGLLVLVLALWLLRDDVARHFVRQTGLRRYNGTALLGGYFWLAVSGATWLAVGVPQQRASYDMAIHGTFLGFGVSMVMAHAPIIFPAVIGRPLPYHPALWLPLGLLNGGLVVRFAGDLAGLPLLWQAGSVINVSAVLVFLLISILLVVTAHDEARRPRVPAGAAR